MYQTGLQVFVSTQQVPALVFIRVPLQSFCRHIYDKHLLFLLSRHHILEIITAAVFDLFFKSSGPQIAIFSRFKEQWKFIDTTKFRTIDAPAIGVKSELTGDESGLLNGKRKDIIGFLQNELSQHLHWLPISTRIEYKVLLIVLKAQMGVAPKYLRDAIRLPTSATSLRHLRYCPFSLESPSTFSLWFCPIIQSFYVLDSLSLLKTYLFSSS